MERPRANVGGERQLRESQRKNGLSLQTRSWLLSYLTCLSQARSEEHSCSAPRTDSTRGGSQASSIEREDIFVLLKLGEPKSSKTSLPMTKLRPHLARIHAKHSQLSPFSVTAGIQLTFRQPRTMPQDLPPTGGYEAIQYKVRTL